MDAAAHIRHWLGLGLWLIGYALGIVLFAFMPVALIGWIITPTGALITVWVLLKVGDEPPRFYVLLNIAWTSMAVVFDYVMIVPLRVPALLRISVVRRWRCASWLILVSFLPGVLSALPLIGRSSQSYVLQDLSAFIILPLPHVLAEPLVEAGWLGSSGVTRPLGYLNLCAALLSSAFSADRRSRDGPTVKCRSGRWR